MAKANAGDPAAAAELDEFLDASPQVWAKLGDLGGHVRASWLGLLAAGDSLAKGVFERGAERLYEELLGEGDGPAERLLVEEEVATHLELEYHRLLAAGAAGAPARQAAALQRRLDAAQKRHLTAVKALEQVRALVGREGPAARLKVLRAEAARMGRPSLAENPHRFVAFEPEFPALHKAAGSPAFIYPLPPFRAGRLACFGVVDRRVRGATSLLDVILLGRHLPLVNGSIRTIRYYTSEIGPSRPQTSVI